MNVTKDRILIIAEAGVNHNGSITQAKKLIDTAAESGADYVKFQTFKAKKLVTDEARIAKYAIRNKVADSNQMKMLSRLELSESSHHILINHCNKRGIKFLSTAFDEESLKMLISMGIDKIKIPSGEITNLPYLRTAGRYGLPVILSSGMATMNEIKRAVSSIEKMGLNRSKICILQCTTEYPAPYDEVNLLAMQSISKELNLNVGYSDHTEGNEICIAATALGAKIIEKHFTLNRNLDGPDHAASIEPDELIKLVSSIRNTEKALGVKDKKAQKSEIKNIQLVRKSIHLKHFVPAGKKLSMDDFIMLRPGDGISPMDVDQYIGKKAAKNMPDRYKLNKTDVTH